MSIKDLARDQIRVLKPDGASQGPFRSSVQAGRVFVFDKSADIEPGDKLTRTLPNGKTETLHVVDAHYNDASGVSADMSHWDVKTSRTPPSSTEQRPPAGTTYNVHAHAVQIGDGNVQNLVQALSGLVSAIDSSPATPAEKAEAKGLLRRALEHPLLLAVIGGASGAFFKSVFGPPS